MRNSWNDSEPRQPRGNKKSQLESYSPIEGNIRIKLSRPNSLSTAGYKTAGSVRKPSGLL